MNLRSSRVYSAPVPKMPPGLVELMEGLARDVLKNNPPEVYAFCVDHMQKLLQIRDGSTIKTLPTLEQKIAIATKKIRDRAAQRHEEFDKKMQLLQYVQNDKSCNDINKIEEKQYIQQNIVKIPQNYLTGNIEHEIIARLGKDKSLQSEKMTEENNQPILSNITNDISPLILEQDIKNIEKVSSEILIRNKNIDDNGPDNKINNSKMILSEDGQKDDLYLKQTEKFQEQSVSNVFDSTDNDNKVVLLIDENIFKNNQNNILVSNVVDKTESITCQEVDNTFINLENSKVEISEETQKDDQNDCKKEDEKIFEINLKHNENNDNIIEETQAEEEFIDNNVIIDNTSDIGSYPEVKNDQVTKSVQKNKYDDSFGHTHNNSMDLETAAITIQKVFRSFLFRNKTLSVDDSTNLDMNLLIEDKEKKDDEAMSNNINKDRRPLGVNRLDTVLQTVNEEKSLSLSTDDSSTLSSAATIIQAHVRGFLVRNNFNLNKTASSTSGIDSDGQSMTSLENDVDHHRNKTVLNIHIVPEGGHFMSRDESMLTSIDLSLDGSPPSSTNLHPLGYDKSERRKQLKREDAVQSISPPSYNSGKLSEDVDSVKEIFVDADNDNLKCEPEVACDVNDLDTGKVSTPALNDDNISTVINNIKAEEIDNVQKNNSVNKSNQLSSLAQMTSDEMDVVTPFFTLEGTASSELAENNIKLMHSGECHDVLLPTKVSRNDTSVVRGE